MPGFGAVGMPERLFQTFIVAVDASLGPATQWHFHRSGRVARGLQVRHQFQPSRRGQQGRAQRRVFERITHGFAQQAGGLLQGLRHRLPCTGTPAVTRHEGLRQRRERFGAGHVVVAQSAQKTQQRLQRLPLRSGVRCQGGAEQTACAREATPADSGLVHDFWIVGVAQGVDIGGELAEGFAQYASRGL